MYQSSTNDQRLYKLYQLHLSRLRKNGSQQDRARVLQRGLAHQNVTVLKESVGTGVFHPLQRPTFKPIKTEIKVRRSR
ncbi:hypothetical protein AALP_AA4G131100 [Arabis alpina]|uniref:Uncharacterized protein n=1 Tax=Arabis alpina TaxID=50452 RepID=A0A087H2Y5_ARAAL|nr:hypothetical protein AALP_AA4G131100 [Arabis alpina]